MVFYVLLHSGGCRTGTRVARAKPHVRGVPSSLQVCRIKDEKTIGSVLCVMFVLLSCEQWANALDSQRSAGQSRTVSSRWPCTRTDGWRCRSVKSPLDQRRSQLAPQITGKALLSQLWTDLAVGYGKLETNETLVALSSCWSLCCYSQHAAGKARIFVLSVLGAQSSGKSTMLNLMFGVRLRASTGQCTRGVNMLLVPSGV